MKRVEVVQVVMVAFAVGCAARQHPSGPPADGAAPFHVFDAIGATGKPDLSPFGLEPFDLIFAAALWMGADMASAPPAANVQAQASAAVARRALTCLDVEQWPLDERKTAAATVDADLQLYIGLAGAFKNDAPGIAIGYYGLPPIRQVNLPAPGSAAFLAWQSADDRLAPLVAAVDVAFPSVYTFTTDSSTWVAYAQANIAEARRIAPKSPLYAFVWPRYHEGTPNALQPIDPLGVLPHIGNEHMLLSALVPTHSHILSMARTAKLQHRQRSA